jgi:molybdenum cofactor cytidylyltransferase
MNDTAIVILAAGNSSRLGVPKQLLPLGNRLLIQAIVQSAINAKPAVVMVVTGANSEGVASALGAMKACIVYNKDWEQGMATSIVTAVKRLMVDDHKMENLVLAVCDQPFVSAALFQKMLLTHTDTRKGIIACSYEDTAGTPVLFHRNYFEDLKSLKGTEGAKALLKKYKHDVAVIEFPAGAIDIDTREDYDNLLHGRYSGMQDDTSSAIP